MKAKKQVTESVIKKYYFLFGETPVKEYQEFGKVQDVKSQDGIIYEWIQGYNKPSDLLYYYDGNNGYVELTEEEYDYLLKKIFKEKRK